MASFDIQRSYVTSEILNSFRICLLHIHAKILDLFKDERKASSLGLPVRGHLSTCVSSLLKNEQIYGKIGQIERCTVAYRPIQSNVNI